MREPNLPALPAPPIPANQNGRFQLYTFDLADLGLQLYRLDTHTGRVERLERTSIKLKDGSGSTGAEGWSVIDQSFAEAFKEMFATKKQLEELGTKKAK